MVNCLTQTTLHVWHLQPYNEVFDIQRFRECELIHGRWCMLATLGAFVAELNTGVSWVRTNTHVVATEHSYGRL